MEELLKHVGLGGPVIYAGAVFALFNYLDGKASADAKTAISRYLKPIPYDRSALAAALLELFDRLYTAPLLGWRAFVRSALYSVFVTAVYFFFWSNALIVWHYVFWNDYTVYDGFITNILSDYLSLFVVRYWLVRPSKFPLLASFFGPLIGIAVVALIQILKGLFETFSYGPIIVSSPAQSISPWDFAMYLVLGIYEFGMPAMLVLLWLPLLVVGIMGLQTIKYLAWAVGKLQWFLDKGAEHPLQAIGYVTTAIAFAIGSVLHFVT